MSVEAGISAKSPEAVKSAWTVESDERAKVKTKLDEVTEAVAKTKLDKETRAKATKYLEAATEAIADAELDAAANAKAKLQEATEAIVKANLDGEAKYKAKTRLDEVTKAIAKAKLDKDGNPPGKHYQDKYNEMFRKNEYEKINQALSKTVRKNRFKELEVILNLARKSDVMNLLETKSLLRLAMTFSHRGYEASKLIMERFPEQVLISEDNQETILHVAVARQDVKGASLILQKLKKEKEILPHQYLHIRMEITKDVKNKTTTESCMEQQLPLSMAAWNCDTDMIDLLLKYGASLKETNDRSQNVFHSLVEAAAATEDDEVLTKILQTCKYLLPDAPDTGIAKNNYVNFQNLAEVLSTRDEKGNTPLTLAAEKGCREIFEVIMHCQVYKSLDAREGISHTYLYDVTEIDSALCKDRRSAMHRILAGSYKNQEKFHEFAEIDPILDLIRIKWARYQYWFFVWGTVHSLLMVLYLTLTLVTPQNGEVISIIGDAVVGFYGFLLFFWEVYQLVVKRNIKISIVGNGMYQILLLMFGVSSVVTPFLHLIPDQPATTIPRSIAMITGWMFTTFFTKGIKVFSSFTVMMQRALMDILMFSIIYLLFLFPYSASMTMLFSSGQSEQFETIGTSLFNMFSVTLGLVDIDISVFELSYYPIPTLVVYLTFLISSYILLLNMVIALLSDTCSQVSSIGKDQWHLQKLGIVLFLEARLLEHHRRKGGTVHPVKHFQKKSEKSSRLQMPRNLDPRLLPTATQHRLAWKDTGERYYLKKKTSTQRSLEEYRKIERWREKAEELDHKQEETVKQPPLARSQTCPIDEAASTSESP